MPTTTVTVRVNGQVHRADVEPRKTLADFLREECALTGTHLACEHGVCGCCTVMIDGRAARSCLTFAVQASGCEVRTIESVASPDGALHPVQQAFHECHALQCGFCTPGFIMAIVSRFEEGDSLDLSDAGIREMLSGNLCRCTGYQNIVEAVRRAAARMGKAGR